MPIPSGSHKAIVSVTMCTSGLTGSCFTFVSLIFQAYFLVPSLFVSVTMSSSCLTGSRLTFVSLIFQACFLVPSLFQILKSMILKVKVSEDKNRII